MTGKVVNLNRARKSRARDDKRRKADANAAKHGRSKAEKQAAETRTAKANADLSAHKVDRQDKE